MLSLILCQTYLVTQPSEAIHPSSEKKAAHLTGSRLPSSARKISPTEISLESFASTYPPEAPRILFTRPAFFILATSCSRYRSEIPCLIAILPIETGSSSLYLARSIIALKPYLPFVESFISSPSLIPTNSIPTKLLGFFLL